MTGREVDPLAALRLRLIAERYQPVVSVSKEQARQARAKGPTAQWLIAGRGLLPLADPVKLEQWRQHRADQATADRKRSQRRRQA